ncbi:MAG: SH3 domain-containing protein [Lachnospiraceae bacterium]|nr:SH3 domain-containing protein [Lachnospiraceae bacterium]
MDRKRKSELTDHISVKDKARVISLVLKDYLMLFKEWLIDYGKVILPIILLICVSITVMVSLTARDRIEAAKKEAMELLESTKDEVNELVEVPFEENTYPEINQLLINYYNALKGGDVDALVSIQNNITNTEIIRLQAMSEYIDYYDNLKVYSKPGPFMDTYIVYAYTDVYLTGQTIATPGLQAFYICKDAERGYYINTGELSTQESEYIMSVASQADVIDLKNTVNVMYSTTLEENEDLNKYWAGISVEIDLTVGEQLAEEAAIEARLEQELKGEEEDTIPEDIDLTPKIVRVQTTANVNVRKSASATADKLGSVAEGKMFDVIERMTNGWTKIEYNGSEGYIKSEFLNEVESQSADSVQSKGKCVANTLLNVRSEASATATKLGVLNEGQSVDFVEEVEGGWCKIKFDGEIGYVKAEYVTIK